VFPAVGLLLLGAEVLRRFSARTLRSKGPRFEIRSPFFVGANRLEGRALAVGVRCKCRLPISMEQKRREAGSSRSARG